MTLEKRLLHAKKLKSKDKLDILFEDIFNEYSHLVAFIIYKYVDVKEDVEDLVMDVFIKFYEVCFNSDITNIKAYLATIAKNKAINFVKAKTNKDIVYDEEIILNVSSNDTSYHEIIEEMSKYLDGEEMEIIILHAVYGHSFVEIAKRVGKPTTTINSIYHRGIKKFRKATKIS